MPSADFEGLLRKGEIPVLRFLFGRLDTPAQAEELTQETLVRAFCALRAGARPAEPPPWLLGIARNVLLETWPGERYRRQLREQLSRAMGPAWAGSLQDIEVPGMAGGFSFAGWETGKGWQEHVERRIVVAEAIEDLPPELRAPVLLHYFADLPLAQVAAQLGTTTGAVKMRVNVTLVSRRGGHER
jgi:RNA polymerase sigma-70 factor (ECF subfamily)